MFLMLMMVGIFYFLVFRPQSKKAKEHQRMLAELKKGDDIVTQGGILGRIVEIRDDVLTINVDEGVKIRVQRSGIVGRVKPAASAPAGEPEQQKSST